MRTRRPVAAGYRVARGGEALSVAAMLSLVAPSAWAQGAGAPSASAKEVAHAPTSVGSAGDGKRPPRAANGKPAMPGVFEPPEDTEKEDATLVPGTISVALRDADDNPVSGEEITLGILINSIAKGDSRKHLQATTDGGGMAAFTGLETASNIAYRVSVGYQGGAFAAAPFQLQQAKAMSVVLHVYPVTRDIQRALVVTESTVAAEVRDDRIQIEEELTFYNLGRTAWQPENVRLKLPDGATAFNAQASMTDQGVDDAGGAAKLRGTFPPGRHALAFRWQIPWSGDTDVEFDVGLPPHVAVARVMMAGTPEISLTASGFPAPEIRHNAQGQRFLVTERRLRPDDSALATIAVGIHGLPSVGPGRMLATGLAVCGVVVGLFLAFSGRAKNGLAKSPANGRTARAKLLDELVELERARTTGDVGPKTYERVRREIVDALARTLAATAA